MKARKPRIKHDDLWADIFEQTNGFYTAVVGTGDIELERKENMATSYHAELAMDAMWRRQIGKQL
jgi:hypothetical protein